MSLNSSPFAVTIGGAVLTAGLTAWYIVLTAGLTAWYINRRLRAQWTQREEKGHQDALPSIISHFQSLVLDYDTTVEEANKRRTASYYEKARQAHANALVLGVRSHSRLVRLRTEEEERILSYWNRGNQSHRVIVVMCDPSTQRVLSEARAKILNPLGYSTDIKTPGVWIPKLNIIPEVDMHITVALPWWWHTIRPGNHELSKEMASRFRQTLLLEFHYPFQIEFERIVLLGGKVLVALWRCVGERTTEDGMVIYDRHGGSVDPFVRLREEIVRCFTTESPDSRRQPLTYQHKKESGGLEKSTMVSKGGKIGIPKPSGKMKRRPSIEHKTPGFGKMGKADGFIHTTLCRLPLECMSSQDVDLGQIHRLCREASATLSGHRMVVSRYRFIESMGEGGESNPCVNPLYEEFIDAPVRHEVGVDGEVTKKCTITNAQENKENEQSLFTIGPYRNILERKDSFTAEKREKETTNLVDMFEQPRNHERNEK